MVLRTGQLNRRLTIDMVSQTVGARAGVTITTAVYGTTWASIVPIGGSESFKSQQRFPEATHEVRSRFIAGLTPKMRGRYTDNNGTEHIMDILNVENIEERNRELLILCKERVAAPAPFLVFSLAGGIYSLDDDLSQQAAVAVYSDGVVSLDSDTDTENPVRVTTGGGVASMVRV